MKRIKLSSKYIQDIEGFLTFIYDTYILEDNNNLTDDAIKLKEHYKYVIDDMELHSIIKFIEVKNDKNK